MRIQLVTPQLLQSGANKNRYTLTHFLEVKGNRKVPHTDATCKTTLQSFQIFT